jgi:hypothetical protein
MSGQDGLRAFSGGAAPAGMAGDLRAIARLPPRARDDFWDALAPNLGETLDDRAAAAITAFCKERRVSPTDLAGPVRACRVLLRAAASQNLAAEALRADLRAIVGEGAAFEDSLVAWYERALPLLRQELIVAALSQHGNLALGVDWRLDFVRHSQGGQELDTPVVLMTFRYRKGEQQKRITLQLVPELVKQLQAVCNKMMT